MTGLSIAWQNWSAELAPEIGGAIVSLRLGEQAILRPTAAEARRSASVRRMACYPLLPYANRIAQGRFRFFGVQHSLRVNFPGSPHPLHGIGWQRPWHLVGADACSCELQIEHVPRGDAQLDWPFAFAATQRFVLGPEGLTVSLSITNHSASAAPAGLGLHPLFPRRDGDVLTFESEGAWENGSDMLPSHPVHDGLWDHAAGQYVGAQALDNDFFGWDGRARIDTVRGLRLRLTASPVFASLRVFAPAAQNFYAVEPVTHLTDAINRQVGREGGLAILEPGATLAGTVTIGAQVCP